MSYYNGSSYSFAWEGRRLVGAVKGGNTMSFTYDDSGLRTSKTVNGLTTEYFWDGTKLAVEKNANEIILYIYDASDSPVGMQYRASTYGEDVWDVYWFDKNMLGDIVGVYTQEGTKLISYSYNAWGEITTTYHNGGGATSAVKNSLRYRGYYFDTDLGLYYLQSRYYDANTCRFISADGYISTGQGLLGYNMFAYCNNNPVNGVDPCGNCFHRWDFWNDCEACGGKNLGEKIVDYWDRIVAVNEQQAIINQYILEQQISDVTSRITVYAGIGAGIGVPVTDTYQVYAETGIQFSNNELKTGEFGGNTISLPIGPFDLSIGNLCYTPESGRNPERHNYVEIKLHLVKPRGMCYVFSTHFEVSFTIFKLEIPY